MRRNFLGWGIFLICLGAVPLAVQAGVIDRGTVGELLRLWPLILIGIGLGLLLRLTPYEAFGGLLVAATLGLLVGAFFAGGVPAVAGGCNSGPADGTTTTRDGQISGSEASFAMEISCADIEVSRAAGDGWHVDVTAAGETPTIDADGEHLRLASAQRGWSFLGGNDGRERWNVTLPAAKPLQASITVNAGDARLNLGGGQIDSVSATFNAADGRLDLRGQPGTPPPFSTSMTLNAAAVELLLPDSSMSGSITLNAASLDICAGPETGLSIAYDDTLGSDNFAAAGLTQVGDRWQSADYATAGARIDLQLSANVSSINLDRSGACQ